MNDTPKTLVVFYSFEGNTRLLAEAIAGEIKADILELKVKDDIKSKGFMKYFWGGKQVFQKKSPELIPFDNDPNDYELIFIGTPVWAFTYAPAIRTLFTKIKLKDKKIALFCCHEGGPAKTLENMKKELEGNDIISENDFINVLKNPQQNSLNAKLWAGKIIESFK
ncbi:MAG: flavodoxin [Candidatus Margulisiibacteriota bacterium]